MRRILSAARGVGVSLGITIIKMQYNVTSARKEYQGQFVPIFHGYLLIFRKAKFQIRLRDGTVNRTISKG